MTTSRAARHRAHGRTAALLLAVCGALALGCRIGAAAARRLLQSVEPGGPYDCGRWHAGGHSEACQLVSRGGRSTES